MFERLRGGSTAPPGFDRSRVPAPPRETYVETADGRYTCHAVTSPDGRWTLAYGLRPGDDGSTLFRLRDGDVTFAAPANRPAAGSIANDGTLAVANHGRSETRVAGLRVVVDDATTVERTLDATISDVVVRPDGQVLVLATRQPDASVYAYDPRTGAALWEFSPRGETPRLLGYHGEPALLYVGREHSDEPYVALDSEGEVVWGGERYRSKRPLSERVQGVLDWGRRG